MPIIYIDTLFLLNAIIDYLLLLAAARVAGEPLARLRFAVAGMIGGAYAVFIFVFPILEENLFKILLGCLMILVAYGKSRRLFRQGLIFLALSFAFAGGVLAISLLGGQGLMLESGVYYSGMDLKIVLLSAGFCYFLLSVLFRNFAMHSPITGDLLSLDLRIDDKEISLTALVDTGNTLQDPLSGMSVIVAEGACLFPFFQNNISLGDLSHPMLFLERNTEYQNRLRLLPYQVVGMQGVLLVIKVDEMKVNGVVISERLVALSPTSVSDGGSYHALISARQAERVKKECKSWKTEICSKN